MAVTSPAGSHPKAGRLATSLRDLLGAAGVCTVAIGLAHREAFFSVPGVVLVAGGLALLLGALLCPSREPGAAYPVAFVVLCVAAAMAPYDPAGRNGVEVALTVGAGLMFYLLGAASPTRPLRLYVAGGLLIVAHLHYLLRFPTPQHEDVWYFLNGGVDLLRRGINPYLGVPILEGGVHKVLAFTYPPGALLVLAPFRILPGDVRFAYIAAEAAVVVLWGWYLGSHRSRTRGREALVLLPLVLPRTSQAFFIFSNHEWVLLALAMAALVAADHGREILAGVALGLGVASKQYFVVFPALFLGSVLRRRSVVVMVVTAGIVILPFLAWGPGAFLRDTVGNLTQPPDPGRLTLWAALANAGVQVPRLLLSGLTAVAFLVTLGAAWRTRPQLDRALIACGLGLALFAFCSSFAAYNYYAYGLTFVTWGLLLGGTTPSRGST